MTSRMECQVCADTVTPAKLFPCPTCGYEVCKACQKRYMMPSCMSCRAEFTQRHMLDGLGVTYVNTVLRAHQERLLMEHERSLLPAMQYYVDRLRAKRDLTNLLRFGPVRAVQAETETAVTPAKTPTKNLPCPLGDCRGFVTAQWSCGVCKITLCPTCHACLPSDTLHSCNPDDLTSIALLQADSRSCPQCSVSIFRTEGCNHMHCTYCGTDFNWDTCKRIKTTTNHHYNGVSNISATVAEATQATCMDGFDEQDQELDIVPRDALNPATADPELIVALYDDLSVVRFTRGTMFRDGQSYETSLTDLRVRFLMREIDDARWTRRVFAIMKSRRRCEHLTRVLDMYVSTARDFQRLLFRCSSLHESLLLKEGPWHAFVEACNASLLSLHSEYGGSLLVLRHRLNDPDQHPLLVQQ